MSDFRVQIRLNVRPDSGGEFIDYVAPLAREVGLRIRNDVPGLLEGDITLSQLGELLTRLGEVPVDFAVSSSLAGAGLVDDIWVHVSRKRT